MNINELYTSFFRIEERELSYRRNAAHLKDLIALLDMCFTVVISAKGAESGSLLSPREAGYMPDLTVSPDEIEGVLLPKGSYGVPEEILPEAREQILLAQQHISARLKISKAIGFVSRFEFLREEFLLDEFECFAMLLAFSSEYDRKYESIYAWLHNNSSDICATKWLAVRLFEALTGQEASSKAAVLTGSSPLCRFLCSHELKKRDRSETSGRLVLSKRVTSFLLGINEPEMKLRDYISIRKFDKEGYVPFRDEKTKQLLFLFMRRAFRPKGCFIAELYGPEGVGRTTLAAKVVSTAGMSVLRVRLDDLIKLNREDRYRYLDMIYTETVLLNAVPCFVTNKSTKVNYDEDSAAVPEENSELEAAARYIARLFRFLFWLSPEKDPTLNETGTEVLSTEMPMLTANERYLFWSRSMPQSSLDLRSFANRYILTPGSIKRSAELAAVLSVSEKSPIDESHVTRAVRQHSVNQLGSYATRINAVFTWDDLVVSDEQKRRMKMICDQVKYRSVVNEDWGFRKGSPYGRGLCSLFYGSPGTGKTMAAQVMANELGLELYRIDISQLSSKYIGETQKNISRLFDKAKNINAMLFFDEADSMFAKRSEVKDSNDRYANADTAFLLQKLEDHEGITILATNFVNNIDDAFKRRIRFMINFVFPVPEVRLQLWKKILPKEARIDEPLDLEFFADRFELSGSNIKEILTNAAYLAASEGCGLKNSHIIEAVKLNFSKYGKILTNADFDYLGGGNTNAE